MNDVQIFENNEFGKIRTVVIDDKTWFAGKDIAMSLGYKNFQKAIRDHVDEEDKTVNESFTVNGTSAILINESGLYSLILSSKLPMAKKFKRWITNEVLPQLHQNNAYFVPGHEEEAIQKLFPALSDEVKISMVIDLQNKNKTLMKHQKELATVNRALATSILEWEDRAKLNHAIRKFAAKTNHYAGTVWNQLYDNLLYKYHISLKRRGKAPYIQHVKKEEWPSVIQTFAAMCEVEGMMSTEFF